MKGHRRNSRPLAMTFALGIPALLLSANPARADAIDGQWCSPQGKHLRIDGPSVTTPGGAKIQGDYDRHSFTYVAPPKEPSAGKKIYMSLVSEEEMDLHVGSPVAKPERWKRCETIS
ncbi:MAG: hypothetical protein KDJ29_19595 [Hyphomicrobiales bacterium]|nr:hypothetical protein [Hyphomicrobiales bacterium]